MAMNLLERMAMIVNPLSLKRSLTSISCLQQLPESEQLQPITVETRP